MHEVEPIENMGIFRKCENTLRTFTRKCHAINLFVVSSYLVVDYSCDGRREKYDKLSHLVSK